MYTLNTTEVHAVCYTIDMGGGKSSCVILENKSPTLTCTHYGEPAVVIAKEQDETHGLFAYGIEPGAAQRLDPTERIWLEKAPTLRANAGDNQTSVVILKRGSDEIHKL